MIQPDSPPPTRPAPRQKTIADFIRQLAARAELQARQIEALQQHQEAQAQIAAQWEIRLSEMEAQIEALLQLSQSLQSASENLSEHLYRMDSNDHAIADIRVRVSALEKGSEAIEKIRLFYLRKELPEIEQQYVSLQAQLKDTVEQLNSLRQLRKHQTSHYDGADLSGILPPRTDIMKRVKQID